MESSSTLRPLIPYYTHFHHPHSPLITVSVILELSLLRFHFKCYWYTCLLHSSWRSPCILPIPDHGLYSEAFVTHSTHWLLLFPSAFTSLQYIWCALRAYAHTPCTLHRSGTSYLATLHRPSSYQYFARARCKTDTDIIPRDHTTGKFIRHDLLLPVERIRIESPPTLCHLIRYYSQVPWLIRTLTWCDSNRLLW